MKRCIEEHTVASFGVIPVGSLWADDSPFLSADTAACFEPAAGIVAEPVVKPKPRKFGTKPNPEGEDL